MLLSGVLGVFLLAGCGETVDPGVTTTTTTTATTTTTTTMTTTIPPLELPGERIEIFPFEGAELMVVGVAADDTLNMRSGPGVDFQVVLELDPLTDGIIATGHNRQLEDGSLWSEIVYEDGTGWANVAFLLHPGMVEDVTSQLWPDPVDRPRAATLLELGLLVAQERASLEPPSEIVVVDGPTVGDLGEITVDVIGMADDSIGGERLWVFAEPDPGGEGFVLRTLEVMFLCLRGVTDGLCV